MLSLSESLYQLEKLIADSDDAELSGLLQDVLDVYEDHERARPDSDDEDHDSYTDDDEPSTEDLDSDDSDD